MNPGKQAKETLDAAAKAAKDAEAAASKQANQVREAAIHTVEHDPFITSQIAYMQLTFGPYVLQIWSRNPQICEATKASNSTVWECCK